MATIARPDTSLGFRTSTGSSLRIGGTEASLRGAEDTLTSLEPTDRVTLSDASQPVVDPLVYNIQQFAETAKDAAEEIATLRGRQTELAYKAATETVDGRTFSNLQDEFDAIDTEVARIQQTASYNDTQVLTARTLRVTVSAQDLNTTVSVADPTPITTDRGYSIESIATVDSTYTKVAELGFVSRSYGDDRAIADNKADSLAATSDESSSNAKETAQEEGDTQRSEEIRKRADEARAKLTASQNESDGGASTLIGATLNTEA